MNCESPTSITVTEARAESFNSGDGTKGGTTNKMQTFVSAKVHHLEPGNTIDGPGCNGQVGFSEPPHGSKKVKDEKDNFSPEVRVECPATSSQSRDTDTPTSLSHGEKVVDNCFLFFRICLLSG